MNAGRNAQSPRTSHLLARAIWCAIGGSVILVAIAVLAVLLDWERRPRGELSPLRPQIGAELRSLAGAQARLVWVQDVENSGLFLGGKDELTALVCFDTDDSRGERFLLPKSGYYRKPLITPKGDRVVFTEFRRAIPPIGNWRPGGKVMLTRTRDIETRIVNWDGSGARTIAYGRAIEVWADPATGREWVYVQSGPHRGAEFNQNAIFRFPIDGDGDGELVWDKTPVDAISHGSFQLSADGRFAVGLLPWPEVGVIDLEKQTWTRIGDGCWTGMAPDNSYRTWAFDGAHRHLRIAAPGGRTTVKVNVTTGEGMAGSEAYHPRWSNNPRFFVLTGPYQALTEGPVADHARVEVLVGAFDETCTRVQKWVKVTANNRGDYFPDLWVAGTVVDGKSPARPDVATNEATSVTGWPGDTGGLVFLWENGIQRNEVRDPNNGLPRQCRARPAGLARYGRYHAMDLTGGGGTFVADGGEQELLAAFRSSNELTLEATITCSTRTSQPTPVIALSAPGAKSNFALVQDGDQLVFVLQTIRGETSDEHRLTVGSLAPGTAHHVAITYEQYYGVVAFMDGKETARLAVPTGTFRGWPRQSLYFGGDAGQGGVWSGQIDGVALYDVALDAPQIETHATQNQARRADRVAARSLVMRATLREMTPIPSPAAIAPYRRCLVVHRYDVEAIVAGNFEGTKLLVAHWGILDGRQLSEFEPRVGATYQLELEPFEEHAQLDSERMDMSTAEFDLPLFYDPLPWHAGFPAAAREVETPRDQAGAGIETDEHAR